MRAIERAAQWYADTGRLLSNTEDVARGVVLAFLEGVDVEAVYQGAVAELRHYPPGGIDWLRAALAALRAEAGGSDAPD